MSWKLVLPARTLSLVLALNISGCAQRPKEMEPLAVVNGEPVTTEDVERPLAPQLSKLEDQVYALKLRKLESIIQERLLSAEAAKRGLPVQTLLDLEVNAKVSPVTDEEIDTYSQANKSRFATDQPGYREQIRNMLQNQKLVEQREAFFKSLRSKANVVIQLKPPPIYRASVSVSGAPIRGATGASVTIVEYSDFHCPYCRRVQPTLSQIVARYGDQVRLAYRHFPLDNLHPNARKASEAALCAGDQGKFWEYHDKLYAAPPDATDGRLKALAEETGLNVAQFEECTSSRKHRTDVDRDVEQGFGLGVNSTPSFFINGRMLSGAQPYDAFAKIVDEELQTHHAAKLEDHAAK